MGVVRDRGGADGGRAGGRGTWLANLGSAAVGLAELACLLLALAWLWRLASRPGDD